MSNGKKIEERKIKITVELSATVFELLNTLTLSEYGPDSVKEVIMQLIDHAQQGIYRPGAWEREWLIQAFCDDFTTHLQAGDPYGRDNRNCFRKPKKAAVVI